MLQFDEYKVKLNNLAPALKELEQALDLEGAERELDMLQAESAADGFWDNLAKAQKVQQRIIQPLSYDCFRSTNRSKSYGSSDYPYL